MRLFRYQGWLVIAGLIAFGCGIPEEQYNADMAALQAELDKARADHDMTTAELDTMRGEKEGLERQLDAMKAELGRLASENSRQAELAAQAERRMAMFRKMLEKFRDMVKSGKLKIKIVDNKMLVEMASAILFPSGSAKLSDEGEAALAEVAGILATIQDRKFQVAGHTDNIPIKNQRFKSNWDLSTARAVAVVQHLIDNGVHADNVSASGYAETQPVSSNDMAEGRAQNRRIEIVLQPNLDELPDLSSLEKMVD